MVSSNYINNPQGSANAQWIQSPLVNSISGGSALSRLQDALERAGCRTSNGSSYTCPNHNDRSPSLSVSAGNKGAVLNCFAGCETKDILSVIGLKPADLFDADLAQVVPLHQDVIYNYVDEQGELLFRKIRKQGKKFTQQAADGSYSLNGIRRVLYNLPDIMVAIKSGETVYLCEGEKDADRLTSLGLTATTNPEGAGKWKPEYTNVLRQLKSVVIIADNDKPGLAHAEHVRSELRGHVHHVRVLKGAVDEDKADVSDHLDQGYSMDQLIEIDEPIDYHLTNKPANPLLTERGFVNWEAAFEAAPTRVPWIVEPFLEEAMTHALWGIPGSGKSLFAMETIVHKVISKYPVLYVDSENNLLQIVIPRLKSFGMTPADLKNLYMLSFTEFEALDTKAGGEQLLDYAQDVEARLVVIDTTSRFLDGDENSADTFLRFYNNTLMLLKRENIASLRLDHPGKDVSRGTRGSSAKYGDIDYEWSIEDNGAHRTLTCTKSRTGNVDKGKSITLKMCGITEENDHFRHDWDYQLSTEDRQLVADIKTLDSLGLPQSAGNRIAREALTKAEISMGNPRLRAAIKARQDVATTLPEGVSALCCHDVATMLPRKIKTAAQHVAMMVWQRLATVLVTALPDRPL